MAINTWFKNGCNYQEGVTLYGTLKGHSPNLLRLFLRKVSIANTKKLKYELGKLAVKNKGLNTKSQNPKAKSQKPKPKSQQPTANPQQPNTNSQQPKSNSQSFYRINQLHPDLHPLAIKQRNDFQTAIALHVQLTRLHPDEESAALRLCIHIENLFDAIETTQKVLDHYVQHKTILNLASRDFKPLSPAQLIRSRNNKSTSVSKYKKKVAALKVQLKQNLPKNQNTKTAVALEKAENKLLHHELELQQLNALINAHE